MSPFSSDSNNMLEASRNPNEPVDAAEPLIFTASGNKTLSAEASVLKSVSPSLS